MNTEKGDAGYAEKYTKTDFSGDTFPDDIKMYNY